MAEASRSRSAWTIAFTALFFGFFWLYVWLVIDPRLLYESHPDFPVFFTGATFLKAAIARYAGPVEYVSGFLAQSYYIPWLGALVITLLTGLICLMLDVLVRAIGGSRVRFVALIPAVILLVAHNYQLNQITLLVGLLLALACAAFYARVPVHRDGWRVALFLALSLALYFAAGGPYLLFAALAAIYELQGRQRRLPALVAFLSIEAVPYLLGTYVFQVSLSDAYTYLLPYHPDATEWGRAAMLAAYVLPPVALLPIGLWRSVTARRASRAADAEPDRGDASEEPRRPGRLERLRSWHPHPAVGWLLLLVLSAGITYGTYSRWRIEALRISYYGERRMWESILRTARGLPLDAYSTLVAQHVNEALFHTGRLPDEMFCYPQVRDSLLFDMALSRNLEEDSYRLRATSEFFHQIGDLDLQLGLVNEAEREAHESLAIHGPQGVCLYRLALVNIAKRQPAAARVFLRALSRHLVYGRRARGLLQRLETDPALASDPEVRRIRFAMPRDDWAGADPSGERDYLGLLKSNRHNRMAFEYLMAFYLLTRRLDEFAANLPRLHDFDYPELPRHYQEAILLYERDTTKRADRCGHEISDEVLQEFADFSRDLAVAGGPEVAVRSLMGRYSDSYFYYYVTGMSGLARQ